MDPTDEVREAIEGLFDAMIRRNVDAIQGHYLQEDRLFIFLEGWDGKLEGWDREENAEFWRRLFEQLTFSKIELTEDVRVGRNGDLAWVGGTIASEYAPVGGAEQAETTQRATWILERHNARWLIVFEHISLAADEPYGTEATASTA